MQFEPGYTVGQYTIEEILGEGGMATIYRATHNVLTSSFALKILKTKNTIARKRLLQEGRVQAIIDHPNIVSVIDIIEINEHPCLVMEFIQGSSLTEWMIHEKPTLFQIEDVFMQILDGVEAAHNLNIVHRDLKPANIMIKPTNLHRVTAKIFDFGVAKNIDGPTMTRTGVTMGTPSYMSPEQIRSSKSIDQRTDIFSLGAMLYRLVTKKRPFVGKNNLETFNAIASTPHRNPKEINPNIPDRIVRAIDGALVKDAQYRFSDCATFRMVLQGKRVWDHQPQTPSSTETEATERVSKSKLFSSLDLPALPATPRVSKSTHTPNPLEQSPQNATEIDPTVSWVNRQSNVTATLEPLPKLLIDDDGPTEYIGEDVPEQQRLDNHAPSAEAPYIPPHTEDLSQPSRTLPIPIWVAVGGIIFGVFLISLIVGIIVLYL